MFKIKNISKLIQIFTHLFRNMQIPSPFTERLRSNQLQPPLEQKRQQILLYRALRKLQSQIRVLIRLRAQIHTQQPDQF